MWMERLTAWLRPCGPLLCALLWICAPAQANDVEVSVSARVAPGARPELLLAVRRALRSARLELSGGDAPYQSTQGPAAPGETLRFALPHEARGVRAWAGTLAVTFADGATGNMPLSFQTEVLAPLGLTSYSTRDDLWQARRVVISLDQPADRVEVEVYGEAGKLLVRTERAFSGAAPGTRLEVPFSLSRDEEALRVRVVAHDTLGRYASHESYPWELRIPHEEVEFDSGSALVRPVEEAKVREALAAIHQESTRYARALSLDRKRMGLYIVGHTDTVGAASANAALSLARARAIGQWFRRAGLDLPLYCRGLGEEAPKVTTADEVDEPRNRRADYILAIEAPLGPASAWQRLP